MVSIKDINKKIKKNLFDPIDKTKSKFFIIIVFLINLMNC